MTVSQQIIDVLNVLCEKFGIVIDWTGENIIPYIEVLCTKVVNWEIASSWGWLIIDLIIIIPIIFYLKWWITNFLEFDWEQEFIYGFITVVTGAIAVFCILGIGTQIFDLIKAYTFPELTIIEFIKPYLQ